MVLDQFVLHKFVFLFFYSFFPSHLKNSLQVKCQESGGSSILSTTESEGEVFMDMSIFVFINIPNPIGHAMETHFFMFWRSQIRFSFYRFWCVQHTRQCMYTVAYIYMQWIYITQCNVNYNYVNHNFMDFARLTKYLFH